jgi:hypothetical protein
VLEMGGAGCEFELRMTPRLEAVRPECSRTSRPSTTVVMDCSAGRPSRVPRPSGVAALDCCGEEQAFPELMTASPGGALTRGGSPADRQQSGRHSSAGVMDCHGAGFATGEYEDLPDCPRLPSPTASEYEELFRHYCPSGTPATNTHGAAISAVSTPPAAGERSLVVPAQWAESSSIVAEDTCDATTTDWTVARPKVPLTARKWSEQEISLKRGDGVCGAAGKCCIM